MKLDNVISALEDMQSSPRELEEALTVCGYYFEKWFYDISEADLEKTAHALGWPSDVLEEELTKKNVAQLRHSVESRLQSGLRPDLSSTGIWALGKLRDPTLQPLFERFLSKSLKEGGDRVLYQALIALDNLLEDVFPTGEGASPLDVRRNRDLAHEYLKSKSPPEDPEVAGQ